MRMKRIIFWSHLVVGVAAGLVILLLSATGVLLTYERQIIAWAEGRAVNPQAGQTPLDADAIVAAALRNGAAPGHRVTFAAEADAPIVVTTGRRARFLLDPYAGTVLTGSGERTTAFFRAVTELHRWLAFSGNGRQTGAAITGAANVAFLFMLMSGVYLWWPKAWTWRMLRLNLVFRRGLPNAKARDYNWHRVFGGWAVVPLFAIVASGVVISYPWASDLVYRAYGETPPTVRGPPTGAGPATQQAGRASPPENVLGAAQILAMAKASMPDYRTLSLTLPAAASPVAEVQVDTGNGAQFTRRTTLVISRQDGSIVARRANADASPAVQARAYLRFLHTGEVYGWVGQTVAGLASMAAVFLVYTGLALAWRRIVGPLLAKRREGRASGQDAWRQT